MQPATPSLPLAAACGVQQEASEPLAWPEVTHRELRTATPAAWPAWPAGCSRLATAVARRTAAAGMATRTTGRHTTVATYSDSKLQREVSGLEAGCESGHAQGEPRTSDGKQAGSGQALGGYGCHPIPPLHAPSPAACLGVSSMPDCPHAWAACRIRQERWRQVLCMPRPAGRT